MKIFKAFNMPAHQFTRCVLAFVAILSLASCSSRPIGPGTFSFALIADQQYNRREEDLFPQMREQINREPLAFVVHLGDFKAGSNAPCTDALFLQRRDEFNQFTHPFIYTTGDNDWVDCRRPTNGAMIPLERLNKLRDVFFAEPKSLGQRTIPLTRQSDAFVGDNVLSRYRDNVMWVQGGIVFVTLNMQGSNDNVGFDKTNDDEQRERTRANIAWLKIAMNRARGTDIVGLFVGMQANPGFEESINTVAKSAYVPFFEAFDKEAAAFGKPILFAHGDTHTYRIDKPYKSPITKQPIANANITRVEAYGSPKVNWLRITVDANNRANPFYIESGKFVPAATDQ
jgi:hypothetical protein